jgi:hypothetical protein
LNIEDYIGNRAAAPFAARDGRNAKCAMIITTILYFDEGPGPVMQTWQRPTRNRFKLKRSPRNVQHLSNQVIFPIVRHNPQNVWQSLRLLRLEGCPTTRRYNLTYAGPRNLTKLAARIGRGLIRDRAGIDDSQIRYLCRRDDLMPQRPELPRHGFDLALIKPASNGIEVDFHEDIRYSESDIRSS